MSYLVNAITEITGSDRTLDDVDIAQFIDPGLIEKLLRRHKTPTLRKRKLTREALVWLIILMTIHRRVPMRVIVERFGLDDPPSASAICKSRQTLAVGPVRDLFATTAAAWNDELDEHSHGMLVLAIDGSTLRRRTPQPSSAPSDGPAVVACRRPGRRCESSVPTRQPVASSGPRHTGATRRASTR